VNPGVQDQPGQHSKTPTQKSVHSVHPAQFLIQVTSDDLPTALIPVGKPLSNDGVKTTSTVGSKRAQWGTGEALAFQSKL
jgi:hypothetical protein